MTIEYGPVGSGSEQIVRHDALTVLSPLDSPDARFAATEWAAIGKLVNDLDTALRNGDLGAAEKAVIGLERRTESRIGRLADPNDEPPPPSTRDQVVELVHTLRASIRPDPEPNDKDTDRV